jgi:ABC-2 type transport system ATP-binding protein
VGRLSAAAGVRVLEALRALPSVAKVDELDNGAPAPEDDPGVVAYRRYAETAGALGGPATQAMLLAGGQVRALHLKQSSLEDVLIYLTGRHLRWLAAC